jgi:uncharacterized protein involved in outer membrane biogenesis
MKRLVWIAGGLCAAVLLLALLLPVLVDLEPLKARWLPVAERALGRHLAIDHVRLSLLPVGVTLQSIAVMDDPAFGDHPFFTADAVTVRPALWPLLHHQIDIAALTVVNPSVTLIDRGDGRWNYQTIGPSAPLDHPTTPGSATPSSAPPPEASMMPPALKALRLINGKITVKKLRAGSPPMVADRINLSVNNLNLGETVAVQGSAHMSPWTAPITLSGRIRLATDEPMIDDADLRIGLGRSDGHLTVHPVRKQSSVTGADSGSNWSVRIESRRLDLDELMAAGAEKTAAPAAAVAVIAAPTGRPSRGPTVGTVTWPGEVTVDATIGVLHLHQQSIADVHASGRMSSGAVRVQSLTAKVAGGTVQAKGIVNLARADRPFESDVSLRSVNVESLQRAWLGMEPKMAGTAAASASITGMLGARWNWQEAVKAIEGRARVDVRDGAILGVDVTGTVTQQLHKLIGRAVSKTADRGRTPFSTAAADATLRQGIASIGSFQVESDDFSLSASGRVGLTPPRPMKLKAEMRLSKPISRQFDKSAVALLSDGGRLAIPVFIQGTIAEPLVLPDAALLAKRTGKRLNQRVLDEVMSDKVDQLRQTGKSLLKGLLNR